MYWLESWLRRKRLADSILKEYGPDRSSERRFRRWLIQSLLIVMAWTAIMCWVVAPAFGFALIVIIYFSVMGTGHLKDAIALPVLSLGLAMSAFPWTASGRWSQRYQTSFHLSGVGMMSGTLVVAIGYGMFWINDHYPAEVPGRSVLDVMLVAIGWVLCAIGVAAWLISFATFLLLVPSSFVTDVLADEPVESQELISRREEDQ